MTSREKPNVVVCGSRFGRVYLTSIAEPDSPFRLAGILARGSERSRACAAHYGVPLYTGPEQLPANIDIACVVVGTSVIGGPGADLSRALLARNVHVLQEHPIHHDDLASCLALARQKRVAYGLNTLYVHLQPVRRFIAAARNLLASQPALFVDATCSVLVSYSLFDIIGRALGALRPWNFQWVSPAPGAPDTSSPRGPFRVVLGELAGVPVDLRIQNQVDPSNPDSHAHLLHRITIGTEGGTLTLVNTHGPVIWCPRPHMPREAESSIRLDDVRPDYLSHASATPIGPAEAPNYLHILGSLWPSGIRRALEELWQAAPSGAGLARQGQYYLTLCRLWQDATSRLGYPTLVEGDPQPLSAAALEPSVVEPLARRLA